MNSPIQNSHLPSASELLQFDQIGPDRFRACHNLDNLAGRTFGGQALGQALAAATRTVDDWHCHSLNGYFIRGGIVDEAIDYSVERVSDSRSFACRRVRAEQRGRTIFEALCSFHCGEEGLEHQYAELGNPPAPQELENLQQLAARFAGELPPRLIATLSREYLFELAPTSTDMFLKGSSEPSFDFWVRTPSAAALGDPRDHHAILAVMSDYWFPGTIGLPHQRALYNPILSLNHTLRIHAPVEVDQWLLFRTETHWAASGRGLVEGHFFDQTGKLIASASQEALLR